MKIPNGFLDAILEDFDNDTPRLICADWLEDHGEGERADFIRTSCKLNELGPLTKTIEVVDLDQVISHKRTPSKYSEFMVSTETEIRVTVRVSDISIDDIGTIVRILINKWGETTIVDGLILKGYEPIVFLDNYHEYAELTLVRTDFDCSTEQRERKKRELHKRKEQYLRKYGRKWAEPFPDLLDSLKAGDFKISWMWDRGFISSMRMSYGQMMSSANSIIESHPIYTAELLDFPSAPVQPYVTTHDYNNGIKESMIAALKDRWKSIRVFSLEPAIEMYKVLRQSLPRRAFERE